jgi:hypothetical protein
MATDADINEDWIKTLSWDLGFSDLPSLWNYLGTDNDGDRAALVKFMDLPAWKAAPDQLKQQAAAWLREDAIS